MSMLDRIAKHGLGAVSDVLTTTTKGVGETLQGVTNLSPTQTATAVLETAVTALAQVSNHVIGIVSELEGTVRNLGTNTQQTPAPEVPAPQAQPQVNIQEALKGLNPEVAKLVNQILQSQQPQSQPQVAKQETAASTQEKPKNTVKYVDGMRVTIDHDAKEKGKKPYQTSGMGVAIQPPTPGFKMEEGELKSKAGLPIVAWTMADKKHVVGYNPEGKFLWVFDNTIHEATKDQVKKILLQCHGPEVQKVTRAINALKAPVVPQACKGCGKTGVALSTLDGKPGEDRYCKECKEKLAPKTENPPAPKTEKQVEFDANFTNCAECKVPNAQRKEACAKCHAAVVTAANSPASAASGGQGAVTILDPGSNAEASKQSEPALAGETSGSQGDPGAEVAVKPAFEIDFCI